MALNIVSKVYMSKETQNRLVSASQSGDIGSASKLLRKGVNANIRDEQGFTALARASEGGHYEIVKLLTEDGASVNSQMPSQVTPLHLAAKGNHVQLVKYLILNGANIHSETVSGVRPIDLTKVNSESWDILSDARKGEMPELDMLDTCIPEIPEFSIGGTLQKKKASKKKKGAKGKKGKKRKGKKKK